MIEACTAAVARASLKVDHLATLQKFVYRLDAVTDPVHRARLESVIETYTRLYVHG